MDAIASKKLRQRKSHIWEHETDEHYVEPAWCSERLFQVERFDGPVHDPCCGFGTIPEATRRAGLDATAADLVDRGYAGTVVRDFFDTTDPVDNIVCNPPFDVAREFTLHA
jgi:methylase of polypeptide subunit release factors